jgi:PAS domain S-box-containing protein
VIAVISIFVAQTTLIFLLVRVGQRRREAQRQLRGRLRFERALAELSASLVPVPPDGIDAAVDAALTCVASLMEIDWVWRWDFGAPADAAWDSARLRCGQPELFNTIADLPPTLRARLQDAGCDDASAAAVPLAPAAVVSGALFWVSRSPRRSSHPRLDELQMLAVAVATVLRRKDDEAALERSDRLKGAILAALPVHVAVLNREGAVIAVNDARIDSGDGNSLPEAIALASRLRRDEPFAEGASTEVYRAVKMIEAVCRGASGGRQLEYRADRGTTECWYLMTAEPLRGDEQGAVVTHLDITERKRSEMAVRESEERFRRMADALPVAIWMCDAEGGNYYSNRKWLETTGRTSEDEAGSGWLDVVHPDDVAACERAFLDAVGRRAPFSLEFRVRRHDGQYRWLVSTGVPRYGADGAFHGYVGGSVDLTERKDAEQSQRDLNRRLMVAQDQERRRIARELHDHLSQQLALLAIELQQLAARPPKSTAALAPAIADAWRRTTEIASDVHAISHRLHPSKMEALGLVATIQGHCRDVSRQNLTVRFEAQNVPSDLPPDRALGLFRVVEEGLSNVTRHSGATEAQVTLRASDADLVLRIADNGRGFSEDGPARAGLGLVSMRERVEALDGALSVVSTPGVGTIVEARMPLGPLADAPPRTDAAPHPRPALRMRPKNASGRRAESA